MMHEQERGWRAGAIETLPTQSKLFQAMGPSSSPQSANQPMVGASAISPTPVSAPSVELVSGGTPSAGQPLIPQQAPSLASVASPQPSGLIQRLMDSGLSGLSQDEVDWAGKVNEAFRMRKRWKQMTTWQKEASAKFEELTNVEVALRDKMELGEQALKETPERFFEPERDENGQRVPTQEGIKLMQEVYMLRLQIKQIQKKRRAWGKSLYQQGIDIAKYLNAPMIQMFLSDDNETLDRMVEKGARYFQSATDAPETPHAVGPE